MFFLTTLKDDEWIVDSGASDHMFHDLSKFTSYEILKHKRHSITIPDGRTIPVKYVGLVKLNNGIVLRNVLYVPEFRFNLITVNKIASDMKCVVSFDTNKCYIQEILMKKTWLLGKSKVGLYIFQDIKRTASVNAAAEEPVDTQSNSKFVLYKAKLWHLRMGHLPINRLKFLFPEISESLVKPYMFCTICPQGKQTRSVYPKSDK